MGADAGADVIVLRAIVVCEVALDPGVKDEETENVGVGAAMWNWCNESEADWWLLADWENPLIPEEAT